jgi:hypothetical protein
MRQHYMKAIVSFLFAAALSAPAWAVGTNPRTAVPGTLNYLEGQVSLANRSLGSKAIGSAELQAGQSLSTGNGKAEILLTPGVFLRLGSNSEVRMISPDLVDTHVALERGHAILEVGQIYRQNDIRVTQNGATTRILKTGLYDFHSDPGWVRVFDGKAVVNDDGREIKVKGGHELDLSPDSSLKAHKFDKKANEEGDLYRWSSLRSAYVAEANVNAAGIYYVNGWGPWGLGWWGAGWYWDPWFSAFTFIPDDGIFYSPFGWGFYSPWLVYDAPLFGYGYGFGGFGRVHYVHHFSPNVRAWGPGVHYVESRDYSHGIYRGPGSIGSGFHSGPRMLGATRGLAPFRGADIVNRGFRGETFHGGFRGGAFGGERSFGPRSFGGGFHGGFGAGQFRGGGFHGPTARPR